MIIIALIVLGMMIGGFFVVVYIMKEAMHQGKIQQKAKKEIEKESKGKKLTKEEKMKIKHKANKVAYENDPRTIALKRFKNEFGHEYGEKNKTDQFRKAQRYQEIKKEVKAEIKNK